MKNEILLVSAFLSAILILSLCSVRKDALIAALFSLMVMIPMFGYKVVNTVILSINATAPIYASVLIGFVMLCHIYGKKEADSAISSVMIAVFTFVTLGYLISRITCIHSDIDQSAKLLFDLSPRLAISSLVAFYVSSRLTIYIYDALKRLRMNYVLAMMTAVSIGQFADSSLFFPLAFLFVEPMKEVSILTVSGAMNKIYASILAIPFFIAVTRHHGYSCRRG